MDYLLIGDWYNTYIEWRLLVLFDNTVFDSPCKMELGDNTNTNICSNIIISILFMAFYFCFYDYVHKHKIGLKRSPKNICFACTSKIV